MAFVAAVSVFVFFQSVSRPGETTARFIPSNTLAYASINLRPGVQQLRHGRAVISTLQTDALVERRDELLDELEDETGIHLLDDVTPWLGESVSFALLDVDDERDTAEWVAMVHVSDRVAALDFAEDLVSYFEDESLSRFSDAGYREAQLWLSDDDDLGFALTEEYLLLADGENTLKRVIRDMESPPDTPLLADEDFRSARESLPSQRVMFMFLRSEWILDLLRDEIDPFGRPGRNHPRDRGQHAGVHGHVAIVHRTGPARRLRRSAARRRVQHRFRCPAGVAGFPARRHVAAAGL